MQGVRSKRSPEAVATVIVAVVGVVVAVAVVLLYIHSTEPVAPVTADSLARPTGSGSTQAPTTSGGSTTPRTTRSVKPPPGAGITATAGPGLSEVGIHVVAQPDASGGMDVEERLRLDTPLSTITISPPSVTGVPGLMGLQPAVVGLEGTADDAPLVVGARAPTEAGSQSLPRPSTMISLRYRLEGASARAEPSPVGRVLMALPPITAMSGFGQLPVVVEVVGPGVRNLVCPQLSGAAQLCGREGARVWSTVSISADRSLVIAQFDLPPGTS